jgi:hypothetical protein
MTIEEQTISGLCVRCKKNKAVMKYADGYLEMAHGFIENICQECYDKMKERNPWYLEGKQLAFEKVLKIIEHEIENEKQATSQRDWTYEQELKFIKRQIEKLK